MYKDGESLKRNSDVTAFLDAVATTKRREIDCLRDLILSCDEGLEETVKWNAPNYRHRNEDRLTMRLTADQVQLIFHRGAKVKEQPQQRFIQDEFNLLEWKANDRALFACSDIAEIKAHEMQLAKLVRRWLNAA